jgi:hypothetical protein
MEIFMNSSKSEIDKLLQPLNNYGTVLMSLNRPVLDRIMEALEDLHPFPPLWVALGRENFLDRLEEKLASTLLISLGAEDVRAALSNGIFSEECPECPITDEQCAEALCLAHKYYQVEHGITLEDLKYFAKKVMLEPNL